GGHRTGARLSRQQHTTQPNCRHQMCSLQLARNHDRRWRSAHGRRRHISDRRKGGRVRRHGLGNRCRPVVAHSPDRSGRMGSAMTAHIRSETGSTLIETMMATVILLVLMSGLFSMTFYATQVTENQGHLSARTTEYAQDKMEQLLSLAYGDATSDTTVFPAVNAG